MMNGTTREPAGGEGLLLVCSARRVVRCLATMATGLVVANVIGMFLTFALGHRSVKGLVPMFNLDTERNIPSYFSSVILLIAAALLCAVAVNRRSQRDPYTKHWFVLAMVFAYISLDESLAIHEKSIAPLRDWLDATGILYFTWVVPAFAIVLVMGIIYRNFLKSLPPEVMKRFILAAILYVAGALGLELPEGYWAEVHGDRDLVIAVLTTVEEALEMAGVIVFIGALLTYIRLIAPQIRLDE